MVGDKNNTISSLNTLVFQLNSGVTSLQSLTASANSTIHSVTSNVTILQDALNDSLNETATSVGLDELQSNCLNYVTRTTVAEGNPTVPLTYPHCQHNLRGVAKLTFHSRLCLVIMLFTARTANNTDKQSRCRSTRYDVWTCT